MVEPTATKRFQRSFRLGRSFKAAQALREIESLDERFKTLVNQFPGLDQFDNDQVLSDKVFESLKSCFLRDNHEEFYTLSLFLVLGMITDPVLLLEKQVAVVMGFGSQTKLREFLMRRVDGLPQVLLVILQFWLREPRGPADPGPDQLNLEGRPGKLTFENVLMVIESKFFASTIQHIDVIQMAKMLADSGHCLEFLRAFQRRKLMTIFLDDRRFRAVLDAMGQVPDAQEYLVAAKGHGQLIGLIWLLMKLAVGLNLLGHMAFFCLETWLSTKEANGFTITATALMFSGISFWFIDAFWVNQPWPYAVHVACTTASAHIIALGTKMPIWYNWAVPFLQLVSLLLILIVKDTKELHVQIVRRPLSSGPVRMKGNWYLLDYALPLGTALCLNVISIAALSQKVKSY